MITASKWFLYDNGLLQERVNQGTNWKFVNLPKIKCCIGILQQFHLSFYLNSVIVEYLGSIFFRKILQISPQKTQVEVLF